MPILRTALRVLPYLLLILIVVLILIGFISGGLEVIVALFVVIPVIYFLLFGQKPIPELMKKWQEIVGKRGTEKMRKNHRLVAEIHPSDTPTSEEIISSLRAANYRGEIDRFQMNQLTAATDGLKPVEIDILLLFDDPAGQIKRRKIKFPTAGRETQARLLEVAIPSLKNQGRQYKRMISRLSDRKLLDLDIGSLHTPLSEFGLLKSSTTPQGRQLTAFIGSMKRS